MERKQAAILIHFSNNSIQTLIFIFTNALFLSAYPTTWLPYLFIGQGILDVALSYGLAPQLDANSTKFSAITLLSIAAGALILNTMLSLHIYVLPLIFTLFLTSAGFLTNIMTWNSVRASLDVIELKHLTGPINIAQSLSVILTSVGMVILLMFANYHILIYFLVVLLIFASYFSYQLKPLYAFKYKPDKNIKPLKYDLFRRMFVTVILISIIYTLLDFGLKYEISISMPKHKIGEFMARFTAIASIGAFIFSLFGVRLLVTKIGVYSLILVLPVTWLVTSVISVFNLTLITVAVIAAGRYMFYYSVFATGRELILNVLPRATRVNGQFLMKAVASPLGTAIASVWLFLFSDYVPIHALIAIVIILNVILILYLRKIDWFYLNALKKAINLRHFDTAGNISATNLPMIEQMIIQSIESDDEQKIIFGYSLLSEVHLKKLPDQAFAHLHHSSAEVRLQSAKLIKSFHAQDAIHDLFEQIKIEQDPQVMWWLFDALGELDVSATLPFVRRLINHPFIETKTGAARILLSLGNIEDRKIGLAYFNTLVQSNQASDRLHAARLLPFVQTTEVPTLMEQLINDADNNVSTTAILAASKLKDPDMIQTIINRTLQGGTLTVAQTVLADFGKTATTKLVKSIHVQKKLKQKAILLSLLRGVKGRSATQALLELASLGQINIRNIALAELQFRTNKYPLKGSQKKIALDAIDKELMNIKYLNMFNLESHPQQVSLEIKSRTDLAKQRLLRWVTIYTNLPEIANLFPIVMYQNKIQRSEAIELLSVFLHKFQLSQDIVEVFLSDLTPTVKTTIKPYDDEWLDAVLDYKITGDLMNTMEKVFVLREVALFDKLAGETLVSIAEDAKVVDVAAGETIFLQGDPPTGLYMVVSGEIDIMANGTVVNKLTPYASFGELALLDNNPRSLDAIANTEGTLLFLEKEAFDRITEDFPEVLRAVSQAIIKYLRQKQNA